MTQQQPFPPASGIPEAPDARNTSANNTLDAGKQAAGDVAQTATDKAQDVAQETKQQARNVLHEAREQARSQAKDQHRNLVTNLRSLADELGQMAQRSDGNGPASDLVGQAGQRAGGVADWLDAREPGQLVDEVRRYARRNPGTFVLGALAAGVLAGRLTRGVVAVHSDDSGSQPAGARALDEGGQHRRDMYPDQTAYEQTGGVQPPTGYGDATNYPGTGYPAGPAGNGGFGGGGGYATGGLVPDPGAFPEPTPYPGGTP